MQTHPVVGDDRDMLAPNFSWRINLRLKFQLILFMLIRTVFNTVYRMVYPFLAVFARGLGVDLHAMAGVMTARSLVGAFGPFLAAFTDSHGRRVGMLSGLALFLAGIALVVFQPTFPFFAVALVLTTLGKYNFDPAMQAYLGDRVPYERRGTVIALTEMGWSFAFILGIPLAGLLIARFGWLAPFPLFGLLALVATLALFALLPQDTPYPDEVRSVFSNFHQVLISRLALAGLALGFCMTVANELINLVFGVWLEDRFGLQIAALGAAALVIGISELGAEGLVALVVDRLGKTRAIALGLLANCLAAVALPLLARGQTGALAGLFFFYVSFEFTLVSLIPLMTEILPKARATLMAFNVAGLSLGRALGAPLATFLYGFSFPLVVAGSIAFNLLALLALGRVRQGQA